MGAEGGGGGEGDGKVEGEGEGEEEGGVGVGGWRWEWRRRAVARSWEVGSAAWRPFCQDNCASLCRPSAFSASPAQHKWHTNEVKGKWSTERRRKGYTWIESQV